MRIVCTKFFKNQTVVCLIFILAVTLFSEFVPKTAAAETAEPVQTQIFTNLSTPSFRKDLTEISLDDIAGIPVNGYPGEIKIPKSAARVPIAKKNSVVPFSLTSNPKIGDVRIFTDHVEGRTISAKVSAIGNNCIVYVDSNTSFTPMAKNFLPVSLGIPGYSRETNSFAPHKNAVEIANEFDRKIYDLVVNNFGTPYYLDGTSEKINILLYDISRDGLVGTSSYQYIAGFFFTGDFTSKEDYPESNEDTILYIDIGTNHGYNNFYGEGDIEFNIKKRIFYGTIAHEFQHLVNFSKRWLYDEMFFDCYALPPYDIDATMDKYISILDEEQIDNIRNMLEEATLIDENDPDYDERYYPQTTTWLNEGLSGLADILYLEQYFMIMNTHHLYYFLESNFKNGIGYIPETMEWDSAGSHVLANYGAASVIIQDFYKDRPEKVKQLVSYPKLGYYGAMDNISENYYGEKGKFNDFFTLFSLNINADTPGGENSTGSYPSYYTNAIDNVWSYKTDPDSDTRTPDEIPVKTLTPTTSVTTLGRKYYNEVYLAETIGNYNNTVSINISDNSNAAYYIISPYGKTGINNRDKWNNTPKIAQKLNTGDNRVKIGNDNMFAVLAIAYDEPIDNGTIKYEAYKYGLIVEVDGTYLEDVPELSQGQIITASYPQDDVTVIIAFYDINNTLKFLSKTGNANVPSNDIDMVKVFVWEDTETMSPIDIETKFFTE